MLCTRPVRLGHNLGNVRIHIESHLNETRSGGISPEIRVGCGRLDFGNPTGVMDRPWPEVKASLQHRRGDSSNPSFLGS